MPRQATEADYKAVQGGKPNVLSDGTRHHEYRNGELVPTFYEMGTTLLSIGGEVIEFPTADLWQMHGGPCEQRSQQSGGEGYKRKR